jgi:hypothetical protein
LGKYQAVSTDMREDSSMLAQLWATREGSCKGEEVGRGEDTNTRRGSGRSSQFEVACLGRLSGSYQRGCQPARIPASIP